MEIDVHQSQNAFNRIKDKIKKLPNDSNKELLLKYLTWHELQVNRNVMSFSSANRSLSIALTIADAIPNIIKLETAPIERYWANETQRKAIKKTQGKIIELDSLLSRGSLQKHKTQILKLYKFANFMKKYPEKDISFFKSSMITKPSCCDFLFLTESKKRDDIKLPNQQKVKELITDLYKSKHYYAKMCAVFVALANDCALRFGEIASLKRKDIVKEKNFYLIHVSESKSAKRTVICKLSKKFLDEWFKISNENSELVFEPILKQRGMVITYSSLRKYLILSSKQVNLELPKNKSFHLFRHCASSRLRDMPTNQKRYFMGWKLDGLESTYTHISWEDCEEYYFKSLKGNPMVDFSLSKYDEQTKTQEELLAEMIDKAVERKLKNINK